jgi:adenine/guanine/hypoxanthine permease
MFCSPLATAIPAYATAPALILVGVLMTQSIAQIAWQDFSEAVPAFITMLATPLTFSIATGLSLGLISYTVVKIAAGNSAKSTRWFGSSPSFLSCATSIWPQHSDSLWAHFLSESFPR